MPGSQSREKILILTPVKDAERFVDSYFAGLAKLTYPADRISLALLESDSQDGTFDRFSTRLADLFPPYASAKIWRKDFGFRVPYGMPRWHTAIQLPRRSVLAKARNHLLFHALEDHDWVLWLDVDVIDYPPDLIERLLASDRDIVHPHCVRERGGATFDRNGWREHGSVLLEDLRGGPDLTRLDSVGGTVLLVRADVHRDGLIFPSFPYGAANRAVRSPHPMGLSVKGEIETEGLGLMALDMGRQCWGMPNLEVLHAHEFEREIRLLSFALTVHTDTPEMLDALDGVALRAEQLVSVTGRAVLTVSRSGTAYRFANAGGEDGLELDPATLVQELYRKATDQATARLRVEHGFVPAASGWSDGQHFLLMGAASFGKTSLAVRLMLDGFEMSGDAWVLLKGGQATPWPWRFLATEEAIALLPQRGRMERYGAIAARPRAGYRVALDPLEFGLPWRIGPAPVRAIFALEPNFGARSVARPCGKVEMVQRIVTRCLPPTGRHGDWIAELSAVVETADTYVLELGGLDSAAAEIASRLSGRVWE